ncbi:hypothetical protein KFE25_006567 [Diacronema lutheri]|uniref:Uncharacterized protein n=1 Tax=Diacronema lutheri TaxID=2081491 RepID=A0A8J6C1P8_DIALT|nr:hypothetical protein KFE25_006567 [Diacronema lutheri]
MAAARLVCAAMVAVVRAPEAQRPAGAPAAGAQRPAGAPAAAAPPRCVVVIDRHNHKTGGTTVRDIFAHMQASGKCLYWGYGPTPTHWEAALRHLEATLGARAADSAESPALRLCVELHYAIVYWQRSVGRLAALRDAAARAGRCRVVLSTRVRRPLAFYWSYWRWTIMGRQLSHIECLRARAAGPDALAALRSQLPSDMRCSAEPSASQPDGRFGFTFAQWVRNTPNLQSRLLLRAASSTCVENPVHGFVAQTPSWLYDAPPLGGPPTPRASAARGPSRRRRRRRLERGAFGAAGAQLPAGAAAAPPNRTRASVGRQLRGPARVLGGGPCGGPFGERELSALFALLDQHDVVGTVEDFDAHLLLVQDRAGWAEADMAYVPIVPRYRNLPRYYNNTPLPFAHPMACADRAECEAAVAHAAPLDTRLWERWGAPFRAKAAAELGGEARLAERLAAFRARNAALANVSRALRSHSPDYSPDHSPVRFPDFSAAELRAHLTEPRVCTLPAIREALARLLVTPSAGPFESPLDECMPVPPAFARIWQANFLTNHRKAVALVPVMRRARKAARGVALLAHWAVEHAALLARAGLPIVPAACHVARGYYRCATTAGPSVRAVAAARARVGLPPVAAEAEVVAGAGA